MDSSISHTIFRLTLDSRCLDANECGMMTKMDRPLLTRRTSLKTIAAVGFANCAVAAEKLRAGVVPAGAVLPGGQIETFWAHCADVSDLGFRYMEVNNTRARIAEAYIDRAADFQERMAKRKLVLAGLALFSHTSGASLKDELMPKHLLAGKFLKAIGGALLDAHDCARPRVE